MRNLFSALVLIVSVAVLTAGVPGIVTSTAEASKNVFPDEALRMLMDGNDRFVKGQAANPHSGPDRIQLCGTEDQGDHAYATILACSDSRVPVERIFDAGFMDLFVVRVAGNVCDTDENGTIEYGLCHVKTPLLVILGHTQCGAVTAVTAAAEGHGHPLERNIPALVDNIGPAVERAMKRHPDLHGRDLVSHGIVENVWQGVRDLFMQSPAVRKLVKSGRAKVTGAVYEVGTGKVVWLPFSRVEGILEEVEADPGMVKTDPAEVAEPHETHQPGHAAERADHKEMAPPVDEELPADGADAHVETHPAENAVREPHTTEGH